MERQYEFMELDGREELLNEITKLEEKISKETGDDCILVAYSREE